MQNQQRASGSEMSDYRTIKDLVIRTTAAEGRFPSYEKLTSMVLLNFPTSKWKQTHYDWYKSKIKTGAIAVPDLAGLEDPGEDDPAETDIEGSIETGVSLERDLHSYLAARIEEIEPGLVLVENGVEYQTEAGKIDLLARDASGRFVVIELKARRANDNAVGQILGYMGCLAQQDKNVRGILVASDFDPRVVFAVRGLSSVKLVKYQLSFILREVA